LNQEAVKEMAENFKISDEEEIDEYLGVKVEKLKDQGLRPVNLL